MAFFILRRRRDPLRISFDTAEEAYAYVCAVLDFTTGAGIQDWSLYERRREGAAEVVPAGKLVEAAEAWRQSTEMERWRKTRLNPGWTSGTEMA